MGLVGLLLPPLGLQCLYLGHISRQAQLLHEVGRTFSASIPIVPKSPGQVQWTTGESFAPS